MLPHVDSIVKGCSTGSVVFLRVAPEGPVVGRGPTFFTDREWKEIEARSVVGAKEYLDKLVERIGWGELTIKSEVVVGNAAEAIAEYVGKNGIDLIVMATHGRSGISRWVWGSVADRILRSACVPVLMVRAPGCVSGI